MVGAVTTVLILGGLIGFVLGYWLRGQKDNPTKF